MKQRYALVPILLVIVMSVDSFGFTEARLQWWKGRMKSLTSEKARLDGSPAADRQIAALIDGEIRRARGIIAVFEGDRRNDGSLTHETRAMTEADITLEAGRIVPRLCALKQLELIVREADSAPADETVRAAVKGALREIAAAAFARDGEELDRFVEAVMKYDISAGDWKNIAVELWLGRLMEDGPRFREQVRRAVIDAVTSEMSARHNRANDMELRALVSRNARSIAVAYTVRPSADDRSILEKTRTWKSIRSGLEKDLASCASIVALLPGNSDPLDQVRTMLKNPDMLEAVFSGSMHDLFRDIALPEKSGDAKPAGGFTLEIPPVAFYRPALDDLHKIRRALVLSASGREDQRFSDDLKKKFDAVIARHAAGTKSRYIREEEKLRRRAGVGAAAATNDREFREAKRAFETIISQLDECGKKSVALVALVSSSRKIGSGEIVALSRYHARRDREYLVYLAGLVSECSNLSGAHDPESAKRFAAAYDRTGALFSFAGAAPSPGMLRLPFLTRQDGFIMKELAAEHTAAVRSLKGTMRASRERFLRETAAVSGGEKVTRGGLNEKIAQEVIDAHFRYAEECVLLLGRYSYAVGAFERYSDRFDAFSGQARSGAISPGLEQAVQAASLIPSLPDFDTDRIRYEFDSKRYLRAEAVNALSRLKTLVRFYRSRGVSVRDVPSQQEISSLERRLDAPVRIRIDAWIMNESNVIEIDRNAARKLSLVLDRGAQARGKTATDETKPPSENMTAIVIDEPGLSISIPRGWDEREIGETERYQGIIRSFHNADGVSSIQLVRIPLENRDAKETAEEWLQKAGRNLVEKQWQKTNDLDCLMILSSDRKRNVSQTCTLSRDGFAVLITGTTARDRYPSFKAQFMKIIGSVQAGKL